jgi:hypothetical protein
MSRKFSETWGTRLPTISNCEEARSSELLLLKTVYETHKAGRWPHHGESAHASYWRSTMARKLGHQLTALVQQHERALTELGLLAPIYMSELQIPRRSAPRNDKMNGAKIATQPKFYKLCEICDWVPVLCHFGNYLL